MLTAISNIACYYQEMYDKLRVDVGGPTAGGENLTKRTDDSIEPFCFHSMPLSVYKELLEVDLRPQAILDWTAGDGQLAWGGAHLAELLSSTAAGAAVPAATGRASGRGRGRGRGTPVPASNASSGTTGTAARPP